MRPWEVPISLGGRAPVPTELRKMTSWALLDLKDLVSREAALPSLQKRPPQNPQATVSQTAGPFEDWVVEVQHVESGVRTVTVARVGGSGQTHVWVENITRTHIHM